MAITQSKKQTVGFRYYMGLHFGLCQGPVDAITEIRAGDRTAWSGSATSSGPISINSPELFGGEEKEGGIQGTADVMMGEPTQSPNAYLSSKQGAPQPGYRGFLGVVFRQGLIACNNPYVKPWAFKVRRILKGWQSDSPWYSAKASITMPGSIGPAMNPAHIVYECLNNSEWGMGYGSSLIDDANFRAAADTFFAEGLGLSLQWTRQQPIEAFIQQIMDHAGAVLAQDRITGLFKLTPLRSDYTVSALPIFDESNVVAIDSFQRPATPDAVNEVIVQYNDGETGKTGSVTVQNLAQITAQGGIVSQTKQYPGIPSSALATRLALRDLKALSTPLARVRFRANRSAYTLLPGAVIRLTWPKLGISSMVLRVLRVNTGTQTDGTIDIEAGEDVFGMPATTYVSQQPIGWVDPSSAPSVSPGSLVQEVGFYELQRFIGYADAVATSPTSGYLIADAVRPSGDALDFGLVDRVGSSGAFVEQGRGSFCPSCVLAAPLLPGDTTTTIASGVDLDLVAVGTFAQIDAEVVRIDAINITTGVLTLGRAVLDTTAVRHLQGARVFFLDGFGAEDQTERVSGEVVQAKVLPRTGRGELAESAATAVSLTIAGRHAKPYPPGRLRINGQAYPAAVDGASLSISWAHRSRLSQNLEGDESGSIGPEAGTTYSVGIYRASDDSFVAGASGLSVTSWSASPPSGDYVVRVYSERGGLQSMQSATWRFNYSGPPAVGWNRQWGNRWGVGASGSDGSFITSRGNLRPIMEIGGKLIAFDNGTVSGTAKSRIYESTDGGQTWGVGYEGDQLAAYSYGFQFFDTVAGGKRFSYGINTYAGSRGVIVADSISVFTNNANKPTDTSGNMLDVGAIYSDGTTIYAIARKSTQTEAPGEMRLYSSTDGLTMTLVGLMAHDPGDPNKLATGAVGEFNSGFFIPSGLFVGDSFSKLKRISGRWFLVGPRAVYYTDAAVPLTGWMRCPTGLFEGATSPAINIADLLNIGTTLVVYKKNTGAVPIGYSLDNGLTWTTVTPPGMGASAVAAGGYVLGGTFFVWFFEGTGSQRIASASTPSGTWSYAAPTGDFRAYEGLEDPVVTASEVVGRRGTAAGRKATIIRSTDGLTFTESTGIA